MRRPARANTPGHRAAAELGLDRAALQQELAAYSAACDIVYGWSAGAQALALLRAALRAGVLDAVRTPRSPAQVAATTGLAEELATQLLTALDAHGVVTCVDHTYALAAPFTPLLSPRAIQPLDHILDMEAVKARALERAGRVAAPATYTALSPEEQLAMARGVMGLPSSPLWQATLAAHTEDLPEVAAICQAGGHALELGCGAASGLLTMLVLYPKTTAVGVDLNGLALEEARRRAMEVGVADRIELRRQDARAVHEEACYDLVFWSAHFFPAEMRTATLHAAYRALRPGGYLYLPAPDEPPASAEALHHPRGRAESLAHLLFSSWGVPVRDRRSVETELAEAGFTVVRVVPNPVDPLAGVMLAQRVEV